MTALCWNSLTMDECVSYECGVMALLMLQEWTAHECVRDNKFEPNTLISINSCQLFLVVDEE